MKLYNTLTRTIEEFKAWNENEVKMYTCGPTVYNYAHIGNLRTYIMEDILEKTLRFLGYKVVRAMNITDVGHLSSDADTGEDKMVKSAQKEKKTVLDIAKFYTEAFFKDCAKLNIKKPEIVSPATQNIEEYIKIIQALLDKDYAYLANGNVYFDTSKLKDYYKLTKDVGEELKSGVRDSVEEDLNKKNKTDFVLWFTKSKFEDQELKWDSPFGLGYPGWHIECSGISLKYLGEYLDIHCGGVDNIFPHHTNEIAQSEAYIGHDWCKYWVHGEHLNDTTGKMSKSKGQFLTLSILEEEGIEALSYRFMVLQSHYRSQLAFSQEVIEGANNAYKKLRKKVSSLAENGEIDEKVMQDFIERFKASISDDMNTANAITLIYEVLKLDSNEATKRAIIKEFDKVLSLDLTKSFESNIDEAYILEMIEKRKDAKMNKDFDLADKIRNELLDKGIKLNDTREGTTYEVI